MLPLASIDESFVVEGLQRYKAETAPPRVPQNARLLVRGWAAFVDGDTPGHERSFAIDGRPCSARVRHEDRHDVAQHFGIAPSPRAGFVAAIDVGELSQGLHRLSIFVDGVAAQEPFAFVVEEPRAPAKSSIRDDRDRFAVTAFHGRLDAPAPAFRLERGLCGIVRGCVSAEQPHEIYVVIDGRDAFPGLLSYPASKALTNANCASDFLACFRTADLQIGTHVAELVATLPSGDSLFSRAWEFELVQLRQRRSDNTDARVSTSIQWFDEPLSPDPGSASQRVFARDEIAAFRGWILADRDFGELRSAYVAFDCGVRIQLELGARRSDVSKRHGRPQDEFCGFTGTVATASLASGMNTGRCYAVSSDQHTLRSSDATITIVVSD